jgi:transposase
MPKAYSIDLRRRVVSYVKKGHSCRSAAARFEVSISFVIKLMEALRATGRLAPKPVGGRRHAKLEPHREFLLKQIANKADITMPELAAVLLVASGTKAAPASLSRWLIRNGYRFKKNAVGQRTRSTRRSSRPQAMAA